jgi:hypothetical protein
MKSSVDVRKSAHLHPLYQVDWISNNRPERRRQVDAISRRLEPDALHRVEGNQLKHYKLSQKKSKGSR